MRIIRLPPRWNSYGTVSIVTSYPAVVSASRHGSTNAEGTAPSASSGKTRTSRATRQSSTSEATWKSRSRCALYRKRKCPQSARSVPPVRPARVVVLEEGLHRSAAHLAQLVDRADRGPHELVLVPARLREDVVERRVDARLDVGPRAPVQRIEGHDPHAAPGRFGVEAGGPVAAPEDGAGEIRVREREHPGVLLEAPPPGHHVGQREHATRF
jgi:hypothetical protein